MFEKKEKDILSQTGMNVLAPVLNSYVLYVLADAIKKDVKTLFFLARDAYFYYLIAQRYVKEFDLDIQCKYLYVSRLSLRVPLYHTDLEQALSYITLSGVDVTPTTVINRSGISEDNKKKFVEKVAAFLEIKEDAQIPRHRLEDVKSFLKNDDKFLEILIKNSKNDFSNALEYLQQMGFGANEKIAVVDSGWVGSIQQSLNVFRRYMGIQDPIDGYYYGLYEIPPTADEKYYHPFLFGPRTGHKKKVAFNNCLFECMFSAPHGMTLRYQNEADKVVPVLSEISQDKIDYLNQVETNINKYLDNLFTGNITFEEIVGFFESPLAKKKIEKALFKFMSKPSKDEAEVFGRLHFSDDVIDYDKAVLAAKLSEKDLHDNHFLRRVYLELRERVFGKSYVVNISGWYEGSVMLYSKPAMINYHLWAYNHYKQYLQYSKQRRWIRERERHEKI